MNTFLWFFLIMGILEVAGDTLAPEIYNKQPACAMQAVVNRY